MDLDTLLDLFARHQWVAVATVVIGLLVRASKQDVPWFPLVITARWRPLASLVLGLASGVLQAVSTGTTLRDALLGGFISGVTAIAGHDTLVDALRKGKDLPLPGTVVSPSSQEEPDTLRDLPPPRA